MIDSSEKITLPKIAAALNISVVTLYKRNGVQTVKEYQIVQQKMKKKRQLQELKAKAVEYINESSEHVYSQKLYCAMGVHCGCLKKIAPELVELIEELRLERNSELRGGRCCGKSI